MELGEITLRQLGNMIVWIGGVSVALISMATLFNLVFVRPLRNWMKDEVHKVSSSITNTAREVRTRNGTTLGEHVERVVGDIDSIKSDMKMLRESSAHVQGEITDVNRKVDKHVAQHNKRSFFYWR